MYTAAIYRQEKFRKIEFSEIEKNKIQLPKASDNGWIGMIQHYFVSAWVPPAGAPREYYARTVDKNLYSIGSIVAMPALAPNATGTSQAALYVGPQDQEALAKIAPGLDLVVDYGWLTVLAKPIYLLLSFLHGIVGNWGWAIVRLTVLIKACFLSVVSGQRQVDGQDKEVSPRFVKLREQYATTSKNERRDD